MSETTNALVAEIRELRGKLAKSIEADVKNGGKALAAQQKRAISLRKKVTAATAKVAKARDAAKAKPTATNKARLQKARDALTALRADLKAVNDKKRDINADIAAAKELIREQKALAKVIDSLKKEKAKKAKKKKAPAKRKAAAKKKASPSASAPAKKTAAKKAAPKKKSAAAKAKRAPAKRKVATKRKAAPKAATPAPQATETAGQAAE